MPVSDSNAALTAPHDVTVVYGARSVPEAEADRRAPGAEQHTPFLARDLVAEVARERALVLGTLDDRATALGLGRARLDDRHVSYLPRAVPTRLRCG